MTVKGFQIDSTNQALETSSSSKPKISRIALVGNFLPRRCGLATFTTDSFNALRDRFPETDVDVYAMTDRGQSYDYPDFVTGIAQDDVAAYLDAARRIEQSGAALVWVQHEFGIFGGDAGSHVLRLLDRVTVPVIVTLHTILENPSPAQRHVIDALLRRAAKVIVMAEAGREILIRRYGARASQIAIVKHGIPDRPFAEPEVMKEKLGLAGHDVILTFGLLSPDKGIETVIAALPAIVAAARRPVLYVVLGATHPHLLAHEGEAYRDRLKAQAVELGVQDNIRWIDAFVELDELTDYLTAADIYATPYLNPAQITSGTLSYSIGLGKPVVSTPYIHARELLAADHGRLVDFRDSVGFAREISDLLEDRETRNILRQRAYALGRTMIWPRYAEAVMQEMEAIRDTVLVRIPSAANRNIPGAVSFQAIERLSDATGMLQHSLYSVPDRTHGYCIDDNARALLLMNGMIDLPDEKHDQWAPIYASFIQYAWNPEKGAFRNFMGFDRAWLEEVGSEDSFGRTLWAIGVTARDSRLGQLRRWASNLFDQVGGHAMKLSSPRTFAFAILGATAVMEAHPGHALASEIVTTMGEKLLTLVERHRRPDWAWFEIVLAYDNCRLPEALLAAGKALGRQDMIDVGLETLDWIIAQQTAEKGHFRAVGTDSFGKAYSPPEPFDQQPLEAWATVDACAMAFHITNDDKWRHQAEIAYRWYLGENDLGLALADPATGECFDGLMPYGLNLNQGAESVLAFHQATCAMTKLLTGIQRDQELSLIAR
ncbi:MAG: glycosyltransferase [Sphingomonadaceae bacterium]